MKRNQNLIELSKDHHHGLLLGWKIKQGFKYEVAADEVRKYILHFAEEALFPHFDEEEQQVLVHLSADNEYHKRTLAEHLEIKDLLQVIRLQDVVDQALLLVFANKLEAHIRFEERELFPYLEATLSGEQLDEIGELISSVHQSYVENYPHEFWLR